MWSKRWFLFFVSVVFLAALVSQADADPAGGVIESGQATINQLDSNATVINQQSDRAVAAFDRFNLDIDDQFLVHQPGSHAILWVKDNQAEPSQIHGRIEANGQVWISNRHGILVGETGEIDTAGTLLTSSSMRNQDFMAGRYEFGLPGNPSAAVINEGLISARDAGLVGLVAPGVVNDGIIRARLGRVGLASGNRFTVDVRGDGLFRFAPDDAVLEQVIDHRTGLPLKHLVSNNGLIEAPGGLVALSAVNTRLLLDSVIDNSGRVLAPTYETQVGRVHFSTALPSQQRAEQQAAASQPRQRVTVSGTIDVSGRGDNQTGGEITILGEVLGLTSATLDASGDAGGGLVLVGSGFMGGQATESDAERFGLSLEQHDLTTASELTVDSSTTVVADALGNGNGGAVVLWSDELTAIEGALSARGGDIGGNGGLIETSSLGRLNFGGMVNLAAPSGRGGTWLLDPQRIAIVSSSNPSFTAIQERELSFGSSIVDTATIEATLNSGASVDIRTRNENPRTFILESPVNTGADTYEMSIYDEINKTSGGDATLSLSSFGRMQFYGGVASSSGALDLNLSVGVHTRLDNPGLSLGRVGFTSNRPPYVSKSTSYVFETNGGNVDLFSVANISGGIFDTAGGDFKAQTAGYYATTEISFSSIQEGTYQSGETLSETDYGFAINTGSGDVYIDASTYNCPSCTFNYGRIRLGNNSIVSSGQVTLVAGPPATPGQSVVKGIEDGIPEIYTDLPVILGQDATLAAVQVAPYADYIPVPVPPTTNNPPELAVGSVSDINLVVGEAFTGLDFSDVFQDDGGFDALTVDITVDPLGIPVSFRSTSDGGSTALGLSPISESDWNRFGTTPGRYSIRITATDDSGGTVSTTFNVIITAAPTPPPPTPTDTPPTASNLPTFTHTASVFGGVSLAVSRDYFADDNGTGNLTLSLRDGFSPPDGTSVSISPDGTLVVSGTIRTPGVYRVPVEAADASGQSVARTFVIVFDPSSSPEVETIETETQTVIAPVIVPVIQPTHVPTATTNPDLIAVDPSYVEQSLPSAPSQPNTDYSSLSPLQLAERLGEFGNNGLNIQNDPNWQAIPFRHRAAAFEIAAYSAVRNQTPSTQIIDFISSRANEVNATRRQLSAFGYSSTAVNQALANSIERALTTASFGTAGSSALVPVISAGRQPKTEDTLYRLITDAGDFLIDREVGRQTFKVSFIANAPQALAEGADFTVNNALAYLSGIKHMVTFNYDDWNYGDIDFHLVRPAGTAVTSQLTQTARLVGFDSSSVEWQMGDFLADFADLAIPGGIGASIARKSTLIVRFDVVTGDLTSVTRKIPGELDTEIDPNSINNVLVGNASKQTPIETSKGAFVRPIDSPVYSVAAEVQLPSSAYPGVSRQRHNQISNQTLHEAFVADPAYAARMENLYPGIVDGVRPGTRGAFSRKAPTSDVTWHHGSEPGQMQLVPIDQHTAGGSVQGSLHPDGSGGFADWGTK